MNKEKLGIRFFFIGLLSAAVLSGAGCSSPDNVALTGDGSAYLIESKAQIRSHGDSNTVTIQIALLPQKALRLEITGSFGVAVATVLMTPDEIRYALHSEKKFYRGPFHEKTLYPVFKKNMDPRLLWRVIHQQSPAMAGWTCREDALKRPVSCTGRDGSADGGTVTVKWTYTDEFRRRIDIISNGFEMRWVFTAQSRLNEYQSGTFVLNKPEDYKEIVVH